LRTYFRDCPRQAQHAWRLKKHLLAVLAVLAASFVPAPAALAADAPAPFGPAVAFFYGPSPPIDELRVFDWVVLEPAFAGAPRALPAGTAWFAYVSVGQVNPSRPYYGALHEAWVHGRDPAWNSAVIDQCAAGWREFFLDHVIGPLWAQGWRAFFLDTLDAYQAFAPDAPARAAQAEAEAQLIDALHERFPGVRLIANRGFEVLARLRYQPDAIAAESMFDGWDAAARRYVEVADPDSAWLRAQLEQARQRFPVPVIVIDYRPISQRPQARATADRIRAAGFIPWVAPWGLDALGVGNLEVQPRRIALFYDRAAQTDEARTEAVRYLSLPLNYLGYVVEPYDVTEALLPHLLDGRYAAIVSWFTGPTAARNAGFDQWLGRQIDGGLKWVAFNDLGIDMRGALARRLGLSAVRAPTLPLEISGSGDLAGFETAPPRFQEMPAAVRLAGSANRLLQVRGAHAAEADDAVAATSWGGIALAPYALALRGAGAGPRWVIDPIRFLQQTIDTAPFPVPDVTTEGGRRILFVHIDGDGFSSRAEFPGAPFAGEVLLERVLQRYAIPTTLSVIEAELTDLDPAADPSTNRAPQLRQIARRAFALPHVEIASHSYSHPFYWQRLEHESAGALEGAGWHLPVPGYRFDLVREIAGSADFIDRELAPPAKRTRLFLWTGDCLPDAAAVAQASARGLLNLNGGDTLITRTDATLSRVSGLGVLRGDQLQVYSPMQNENVYTNGWTGPFYGYQRVIETFEMTAAPRRLLPIDIYFHSYSATKAASLAALERVYDWALAQPVTALFASDYVAKVVDFHHAAVARDWRDPAPHWRIAAGNALRTLRLDPAAADTASAAPAISIFRSRAVAGAAHSGAGTFIHLSAPLADIVLGVDPTPGPSVVQASGRIDDWHADRKGAQFTLYSYHAPSFTLAHVDSCRVTVDGVPAQPDPVASGTVGPDTFVIVTHHATSTTASAYHVGIGCP
jgi:hypothetical protein